MYNSILIAVQHVPNPTSPWIYMLRYDTKCMFYPHLISKSITNKLLHKAEYFAQKYDTQPTKATFTDS